MPPDTVEAAASALGGTVLREALSRRARIRTERRIRRGLRAGLATAAIAAVTAGAGLVAVPALATSSPAPSPTAVRVVGGNHQVTAGWVAVPGATGYTVRLSTSSTLRSAKVVHTTGLSRAFTRLTNGRKYYVRVAPEGVLQAAAAQSTVKAATATGALPLPVSGLRLTPVATNRLRVSWSGGGNATKVALIAGSMSLTDVGHFSTAWRPATTRSITLTVPSRLTAALGGGSGNYVFVKVAQSNSTAADPTRYLHDDSASRYVLSQSGNAPRTWGLAGSTPPPTGQTVSGVTVASWNVQGITASAGFTEADRWAQRLPRVVANIEDVKPDLIGLQELGTARMDPGCLNSKLGIAGLAPHCEEQYESLQQALGTEAVPYADARTDAWKWVYDQAAGAYVDSMLFFNPKKIAVEASGFVSPRSTLGVAGWPGSTDQAGMWGRFRVLATGQRFVAASIHLPVDAGSTWDAVRQEESANLATFLDAEAQIAGTRLPIVLTGDLNANGATDPRAGSLVLRAKGYADTAATPNRTGQRYSSSNGTNGTDYPAKDYGYPVHAVIHRYPTSRIDYILTKGSAIAYSYANLVRIAPGATDVFDRRYNGSDHNLQLARIGIAAPAPGS